MKVVIDNDVIHKGACYGILHPILAACDTQCTATGVLGAARFVVAKKIRRTNLNRGQGLALRELEQFISAVASLEPTDDEQNLAADLESAAQAMGVSFDTGESQLCAIAIRRAIPLLLTGDKRAIAALERLLDKENRLQALAGNVLCLEQTIIKVLQQNNMDSLRTAICNEPAIDKTLTICFACSSSAVHQETVFQGLESYIKALRSLATRMLAPR